VLHEEQVRRPIYRNKVFVDAFSKTGRFKITHKEGGVYNLTIVNITITDAGEYQCIEDEGFGQTNSFILNVNGENASINFACSLFNAAV
jgi:hypothetical protein